MKKAKRGKKILIKIIIFVLTLCLVGGIFFAAYYFVNNKASVTYTSSLKQQKKAVDNANKNAAKAADTLGSITEEDKEALSQVTDAFHTAEGELKKAITATRKISIPSKYQTQYEQLLAGMDFNKKLYTQALLIIENPTSADRADALKDLGAYISSAASSYYKGEINGVAIELPNEILSLQGTVDNYSEDIYNEHQDKITELNKNKEYYDAMNDVIRSFKNEMTDLSYSFKKITSGQSTVTDIYSVIEKKLISLTNINTDYKALSVPAVAADVHKSFNSILDSYISYCEDYESALLEYQSAGQDETALAQCSITLGDLDEQYVNIYNNFENFSTSFSNSKNKNTDSTNL